MERTVEISTHAGALLDRALSEFGATVFWNMRPARTARGILAAARALEKRGNLAAAHLAAEMRDAVRDAT